jgi:outer membrane protein TolC
VIAGYTQRFHFLRDTIRAGSKCLGEQKPSDGVLDWFFFYRLKFANPIFSGFETRSKVRQADIQLRTMKEDLIDTKLSLDLAYANAKLKLTIVS